MTSKEMLDKYGDIEVTFVYYYKYTFTFASSKLSIWVEVGGDADDIYRFEVTPAPIKIKDLPVSRIIDKGVEVYSTW